MLCCGTLLLPSRKNICQRHGFSAHIVVAMQRKPIFYTMELNNHTLLHRQAFSKKSGKICDI